MEELRRVSNPPNPYHSNYCDWLGQAPKFKLEVYEERAKSILSKNDSPNIQFTYSVNPYRGCFHGCAYCYARPSHQYLDFGAGTDFERKIVVKVNAADLLMTALQKKNWNKEEIVFSGNTDCYQPLEASYELTRRCLTVCRDLSNPVSIITKSALIRRDIELLKEIKSQASVHVTVSVAFSDQKMARLIEPYAPSPKLRLQTLRELSMAGIKTCVSLAPLIPGLNDNQIPEVLRRAKEAGATSAFMTLVRLPGQVKDVFTERIKMLYPQRSKKILHQIQDLRSGKLYQSDFGTRMKGSGEKWDALEWIFNTSCERLGLN